MERKLPIYGQIMVDGQAINVCILSVDTKLYRVPMILMHCSQPILKGIKYNVNVENHEMFEIEVIGTDGERTPTVSALVHSTTKKTGLGAASPDVTIQAIEPESGQLKPMMGGRQWVRDLHPCKGSLHFSGGRFGHFMWIEIKSGHLDINSTGYADVSVGLNDLPEIGRDGLMKFINPAHQVETFQIRVVGYSNGADGQQVQVDVLGATKDVSSATDADINALAALVIMDSARKNAAVYEHQTGAIMPECDSGAYGRLIEYLTKKGIL